jgi:hypothetical protein
MFNEGAPYAELISGPLLSRSGTATGPSLRVNGDRLRLVNPGEDETFVTSDAKKVVRPIVEISKASSTIRKASRKILAPRTLCDSEPR